MKWFIQKTRELIHSKDAVTAIEYSLIAALVAVAIITALNGLATALNATYNTIAGHLGAAPH